MGLAQWIKAGVAGISIVGFGAVNFIYNTPTDEELIAKLSPELKKKYFEERERRGYITQWALEEGRKTAASKDPIWMTGDIPSGMVMGEDGRGRKVNPSTLSASSPKDDGYLPGEGLATVPPVLAEKHNEWAKREQKLKSEATMAERERLKLLAEKEGKL